MPSSFSSPAPPDKNRVPFEVAVDPVDLPVCPRCGRVGKTPGSRNVTFACTGSMQEGTSHKRTRMVEVRFYPGAIPQAEEAAA